MPSKNADKPATQAGLQAGLKAVRAELKATREDLRAELKAAESRLDKKIDQVDKKIDRVIVEVITNKTNLEESFRKEMESNTNRIINVLDGFVKKVDADNRAMIIHGHVLGEHGEKLQDRDKRLVSLESKV